MHQKRLGKRLKAKFDGLPVIIMMRGILGDGDREEGVQREAPDPQNGLKRLMGMGKINR